MKPLALVFSISLFMLYNQNVLADDSKVTAFSTSDSEVVSTLLRAEPGIIDLIKKNINTVKVFKVSGLVTTIEAKDHRFCEVDYTISTSVNTVESSRTRIITKALNYRSDVKPYQFCSELVALSEDKMKKDELTNALWKNQSKEKQIGSDSNVTFSFSDTRADFFRVLALQPQLNNYALSETLSQGEKFSVVEVSVRSKTVVPNKFAAHYRNRCELEFDLKIENESASKSIIFNNVRGSSYQFPEFCDRIQGN